LNNYPKSIELLGIFKNILSIFCGIIVALDMGKNIESAFISIILKNLKNISDFNETVLIEPAGIGDIFLSCSSEKSRNFRFGSNLVLKKNINKNDTVEGYYSLINLNDNRNNSLINNMNMVINGLQNNKSLSEIKNLVLEIIHNYS
jgi:glycerol-3-phosphate dehydrogenase (NAD(P)+)